MQYLWTPFLLLLASIAVVRLIPSPERTAHEFHDLFQVTDDLRAAQMRIVTADSEQVVVEETQGKSCIPGAFEGEGSCSPPYHYHTYQSETLKFSKEKSALKSMATKQQSYLKAKKWPVHLMRGIHTPKLETRTCAFAFLSSPIPTKQSVSFLTSLDPFVIAPILFRFFTCFAAMVFV